MTLDEEWNELKPKILELMEEGWSRPVVFGRLGIYNNSKLYNLCYKPDSAFKSQVERYNKRRRVYGFYHRIINSSPDAP